MHVVARILLVAILLVGAGAPLAAAPATAAGDDTVHVEHAVELTPDRPDSVRVTATVSVPSEVTRLSLSLPDGATVLEANGFDSDGTGTFRWDEHTASPSITYEVDPAANATVGEGVDYADTGPWALVGTSSIGVDFQYYYRGSNPGRSESLRVVGEGVAGPTMAYLGAADLRTYDLPGQTLRLVVPNGSTVDADRAAATLDNASSWLRVGDTDPSVTMFVARDPIRRGGLVSKSSAEMERSPAIPESGWVHESARFALRSNTWVHEYVHTRQGYVPTDRMAWIDEGSASYYESLLTLYSGTGEFDTFHEHVSTSKHADAVLLDQADDGEAQYSKGMRVVAALDARIHAATNGEQTFQDVVARMNERGGDISYAEFSTIVARVAGTDMGDWLDRYVAGDEAPPVPENSTLFTPAIGTGGDVDGDGLDTAAEVAAGTDSFRADTDGDGLDDATEVDGATDPTVADTDGDGLDDATEVEGPSDPTVADTDDDGLDDGREIELGTDPTLADTDGDGIPDPEEVNGATDPTAADTDGDGLDDATELDGSTDPTAADTDGDGLDDAREVDGVTDPTLADTDGDGLDDAREVDGPTDPTVADTDDDGLDDGREIELGSDPLKADTDGDGLSDAREVEVGSAPSVADSDGDGLLDGREVEIGTDPTQRDSDGDGYTDRSEQQAGTDPTASTGFFEFWFARLF